jgi:Ion channel
MTAVAAGTARVAQPHPAQFRYGVVFVITLTLVLFEIAAPEADWARAVGVALGGAALTVAVSTSRARGEVRRLRGLVVGCAALAVVVLIAVGALSYAVISLIGVGIIAAVPVTLIGGLVRLIKDSGVTLQAVVGSLTIYLLVGMLFAFAIGFVSKVESGSYFTQATHVTTGVRVYYSFTVLTTTGFGDYSAAHPAGHALAVLEMLVGQLYLVTVIGVIVGNFARRRT